MVRRFLRPFVIAASGLGVITLILAAFIAPSAAAPMQAVSTVSTGSFHSCALMQSGTVRCWGDNTAHQLGDGTTTARTTPTTVVGLTDVVSISTGSYFSCAALGNGSVRCWGTNQLGELGDDSGLDHAVPFTVPGVSGATALSSGDHHTCAIVTNGAVKCWGWNLNGRLGNGTTSNQPGAVQVVGLGGVSELAAGAAHTCAVASGAVSCWGANGNGQLGDGTTTQRPAPVAVSLPAVNRLGAGAGHTCATLNSSGNVRCWGRNDDGQLGDGTQVERHTPVTVLSTVGSGSLANAYRVNAGSSHTCAAISGGAVCWGANSTGQAGVGIASPRYLYPVNVAALDAVVELDAGDRFTCAVSWPELSPPFVRCWGDNAGGQLGDGSTAMATSPRTVQIPNSNDSPSSEYVPLNPARLLDTRPGYSTVDGQFAATGRVAAQGELQLTVRGRGEVGANASVVMLNVTATESLGDGYLTVYPCGSPRPTASNVNFAVGQTVPNAVTAMVGEGGKVCIYAFVSTHLVVDVNGYFLNSGPYEPLNPKRLMDTRVQFPTTGTTIAPPAKAVPNVEVPLSLYGVPGGEGAVALNVTVTNPEGVGYVTAYPCGTPVPNASNLNFVAGQSVANLVVAVPGTTNYTCFVTSAKTHLIADASGIWPLGTGFKPLSPARLLDTRPTAPTIDGQFAGLGKVGQGGEIQLTINGRGGVLTAETVVLNITVTEPVDAGFITVYPCGSARPNASSLNYVAGQTVPNAVFSKVGAGGKVCIYTSQPTHLLADVAGYYRPPTS